MFCRFPHRVGPLRRAAFSLVEVMIAVAVLGLVIGGFYATFLRVNDYAASSRTQTAAKFILQRAATLATTVNWDYKDTAPPTILQNTQGNFVPYDLEDAQGNAAPINQVTPAQAPPQGLSGKVVLFRDPTNQEIITGVLQRKVTPIRSAPGDPNADALVQITLRIVFTLHGRDVPPVTFYTLRARNSNPPT